MSEDTAAPAAQDPLAATMGKAVDSGIDPATIAIILEMVITLWQLWKNRKTD